VSELASCPGKGWLRSCWRTCRERDAAAHRLCSGLPNGQRREVWRSRTVGGASCCFLNSGRYTWLAEKDAADGRGSPLATLLRAHPFSVSLGGDLTSGPADLIQVGGSDGQRNNSRRIVDSKSPVAFPVIKQDQWYSKNSVWPMDFPSALCRKARCGAPRTNRSALRVGKSNASGRRSAPVRYGQSR